MGKTSTGMHGERVDARDQAPGVSNGLGNSAFGRILGRFA